MAQDSAVDRDAVGRQGQSLYGRRTDDLLVTDAATFHSAVRCHRGREIAGPGLSAAWQNKSRRVRDGILDRTLRLRSEPESVEPTLRARWLKRRFCRGSRGRGMRGSARFGYWRIDSTAGCVLWRGGPQADLRAGFSL